MKSAAVLISAAMTLLAAGASLQGFAGLNRNVSPQNEDASYRIAGIRYWHLQHREGLQLTPEEYIQGPYGGAHRNEINASILAYVVIQGQPGNYTSDRSVRIVARLGAELAVDETVRVGVLHNKTGQYFVPVLVRGPLCAPLFLEATILGQPGTESAEMSVPFNCGE